MDSPHLVEDGILDIPSLSMLLSYLDRFDYYEEFCMSKPVLYFDHLNAFEKRFFMSNWSNLADVLHILGLKLTFIQHLVVCGETLRNTLVLTDLEGKALSKSELKQLRESADRVSWNKKQWIDM